MYRLALAEAIAEVVVVVASVIDDDNSTAAAVSMFRGIVMVAGPAVRIYVNPSRAHACTHTQPVRVGCSYANPIGEFGNVCLPPCRVER